MSNGFTPERADSIKRFTSYFEGNSWWLNLDETQQAEYLSANPDIAKAHALYTSSLTTKSSGVVQKDDWTYTDAYNAVIEKHGQVEADNWVSNLLQSGLGGDNRAKQFIQNSAENIARHQNEIDKQKSYLPVYQEDQAKATIELTKLLNQIDILKSRTEFSENDLLDINFALLGDQATDAQVEAYNESLANRNRIQQEKEFRMKQQYGASWQKKAEPTLEHLESTSGVQFPPLPKDELITRIGDFHFAKDEIDDLKTLTRLANQSIDDEQESINSIKERQSDVLARTFDLFEQMDDAKFPYAPE